MAILRCRALSLNNKRVRYFLFVFYKQINALAGMTSKFFALLISCSFYFQRVRLYAVKESLPGKEEEGWGGVSVLLVWILKCSVSVICQVRDCRK